MTQITGLYPRLVVDGAARAIDFYITVFDAKEIERYTNDEGRIVHAAVLIGGAKVAVKDEGDGDPAPTSLGGSPVILAIEVDDADAVGARMEQAGATVVFPISAWAEGMYGGRLADPFGHLWMIAQR